MNHTIQKGMDEMTASTKQVNTEGELKIISDSKHQHQHHHHSAVAAARRRRMEIRRFKDMANSGSLVEPVSKRSRLCSGDVKPYSSVHVLSITSSSSSSSSIEAVVDYHPCDDYNGNDEGEGECSPLIQNDNTFEPHISTSLQQDLTSKGSGLACSKAEEQEEKEYSSTIDAQTTPTLLNINTATSSPIGYDESSGDFCSSVTVNNSNTEPNCCNLEKHETACPPWDKFIAHPLAFSQEVSSATGSVEQELVSSLDLQSGQSDPEAVGSTIVDSVNISTAVLVPATSERSGSGAKTRCVASNGVLPWGSVSIRGMRAEMEDAMAVVPNLLSVPCEIVGGCVSCGSDKSNETSALHYFGVYDGHGGPQAANFCRDRLHHALIEEFEVAMNRETVDEEINWQGKWEKAFADCFHKVDVEVGGGVFGRDSDGQVVLAEGCGESIVPETVGSTAVVAVVGSCQIIVSNCGDSRAVLSRGGRAISLSVDHKPDREDELARIEAAGGKVINWKGYRIFGVLAMSRAIGDRYLKPSVIPDPEVTFTQRTEEDECLILASDGLWDVVSNEEACRVARRRLARGFNSNASSSSNVMYPSAQAAAECLSRLALERNSSDNITVVVVDLKARRRCERRC